MKSKLAKIAGISSATLLLFWLIQDLRVELNEIRERLTRVETLIEVHK